MRNKKNKILKNIKKNPIFKNLKKGITFILALLLVVLRRPRRRLLADAHKRKTSMYRSSLDIGPLRGFLSGIAIILASLFILATTKSNAYFVCYKSSNYCIYLARGIFRSKEHTFKISDIRSIRPGRNSVEIITYDGNVYNSAKTFGKREYYRLVRHMNNFEYFITGTDTRTGADGSIIFLNIDKNKIDNNVWEEEEANRFTLFFALLLLALGGWFTYVEFKRLRG